MHGLAGGQFHFGIRADDFQLIARLELGDVVLGFEDQFALGGDQTQGLGFGVASLYRRGEPADGLAAVQAQVAGDGSVAGGAAGQRERFAGAPVQGLAGDDADAGRGVQAQ